MFFVLVVASLHPRVALSLASRIVLASAMGVYVTAALAFSRLESTWYARLLWLVPLSVVVFVTRDVVIQRELRGLPVFPLRPRDQSTRRESTRQVAVDSTQPDVGAEARSRIDRAMNPAASSAELEELAYRFPEARRAVASHAATPANVLSWLASHGDDAVVAAIASRQGSGNTTAIEG
ncbi:MAG TPA: hypothetical protein VFD20_04595 [Demequina sp.]|nr:hypothetical protein [Demequina sp.]